MRVRLLCCVFLAGCTASNSNNNNKDADVLPCVGSDCPDLAGNEPDLAGVDLRGRDLSANPGDDLSVNPNADLSMNGSTDMAMTSPSPTPSPSPSPTPTPSPSPSPSPLPCGGALGTHPLTHYVVPAQVFAGDNAAFVLAVPNGFRLQGNVQIPTVGTPIYVSGSITFSDDQFSYTANAVKTSETSFSYSLVIPPGTYTVASSVEVSLNAGNYPTIKVTHTEASTVELCQDKTLADITLPSVGSVQSATVHVAGMENVGTPNGGSITIFPRFEYKPNANTAILATGGGTISSFPIGGGSNFDIPVTVPVQQTNAALEISAQGKTTTPTRGGTYDFQITQGTNLAAGNSYNFTVPTMATTLLTLTGTVGGSTAKLRPASVTADPATEQGVVWCNALNTGDLQEFSGAGFYSDALGFTGFLRKGVSCGAYAQMPVIVSINTDVPRENKFATLFTPDPSTITTPPVVNGNLTPTINVPNFSTTATITGALKDLSVNPLDGYTVQASSTVLNDAGNLSGDSLNLNVTTDGSGAFILHLLPGTYGLFLAK